MSNNMPSVESIINVISMSNSARNHIHQFTKKLDEQGVLDLFFNKEKLDILMTTLRQKNVLSGNFAWIDFSSEYLRRDVTAALTHDFAGLLLDQNAFSKEAIESKLKVIISDMEKPERAIQLYFWLFNYASKVANIFIQALSEYYATHPKEEKNYMPLVTAAIPSAKLPDADCKFWAITHSRLFNKIYWDEAFTKMPFEVCYAAMFKNSPKTPGGSSKEEIKNDVFYNFKLLIIDEVFKKLTKTRERTAKNIAVQAICLFWERKIFIHMLYVKAFVWITLNDKERFKILNNDNPSPGSHYAGFGNFPS